MDEATVRDLVAEAASGNQAAWDRLVTTFSGLVWSVVRGHGIFGAEAADICQTVWLRLVEHLDRLREPERTGAWLATTARHECLRVLRRSSRSVPVGELPDEPDVRVEMDPASAAVASDQHRLLMQALEHVPPACQSLLRLLIAEPPLSYEDIGRILDIPKGSIGPTRQRCLGRVRTAMATLGGGRITDAPPGSGSAKEVAP
jgi:RNA polymerase sigma factor (sigma-70 family)